MLGNSDRLDVFQAERHSTGSRYKLTLRGFLASHSKCTPPLPPSLVFVRDYQASCPSSAWVTLLGDDTGPRHSVHPGTAENQKR